MDVSHSTTSPNTDFNNSDICHYREISQKLEISFIAEMLSFVGMKGMDSDFGGGVGEEQFQSFLREQHAKLISDKGGLGLAEQFLNSIIKE